MTGDILNKTILVRIIKSLSQNRRIFSGWKPLQQMVWALYSEGINGALFWRKTAKLMGSFAILTVNKAKFLNDCKSGKLAALALLNIV